MCKFHVGQKVACVKTYSFEMIKKGEIYTVSNIQICRTCGDVAVNLVEVESHAGFCKNWHVGHFKAFSETCFRPVAEHTASIDAECLTAYEYVPETVVPKVKEVENA